jgi:glycosyltransferase involved in cell wall biosynthesis
MKIGFNGQRLAGQRFGVGRYIEYLLGHWGRILPPEDELTVFLRQPLPDGMDEFGPRVGTKLLRYRGSGIPWENMHLRGPASKLDVLFSPAYTAPLFYSGPLVVATHSVNETEAQAHSLLYQQTYSRIHRHSARIADRVVVPGQMTKDAVMSYYGIPEERIAIVHQGADDAFRPLDDQAVAEATRRRFFSDGRPYILFVGKGSQRRNIPMLIAAFARLKAEGFPHGLVLFGPYKGDEPLDKLTAELGVTEHVHQTEGVLEQHADIVPVYASADVFVHPSENEGWSMTTVEAMACGTAVIASRRGGLGEVADGYALMLDSPTTDGLTEALRKVLTDDGLRADLEGRSRERGEQLRWDIIARQTLDVVRDVGATRRRH